MLQCRRSKTDTSNLNSQKMWKYNKENNSVKTFERVEGLATVLPKDLFCMACFKMREALGRLWLVYDGFSQDCRQLCVCHGCYRYHIRWEVYHCILPSVGFQAQSVSHKAHISGKSSPPIWRGSLSTSCFTTGNFRKLSLQVESCVLSLWRIYAGSIRGEL